MTKSSSLKSFSDIFQKIPASTKQLMSEVATIALNNFVEFHFRLAMILDHLSSRSGSLTAEAEKLVNDYMRQSLEKEFASEDDSC